jgi:hypothetical protein
MEQAQPFSQEQADRLTQKLQEFRSGLADDERRMLDVILLQADAAGKEPEVSGHVFQTNQTFTQPPKVIVGAPIKSSTGTFRPRPLELW